MTFLASSKALSNLLGAHPGGKDNQRDNEMEHAGGNMWALPIRAGGGWPRVPPLQDG